METKKQQTVNELMNEIKKVTVHQKAQSLTDQIKVQRAILNDPTYKVSIYDKHHGKVGERCPREEAVKFIADKASDITGLDRKSAADLAKNYEFSKKDAIFFLNMNQDFTTTYLYTGRKYNIIQSEDCEGSILLKPMSAKQKYVPSKNGPRIVTVPSCNKLVAKSRVPKYRSDEYKEEK